MNKLIKSELADLATKINQEHSECKAAIQAGLQHAVKAGDLLIEAKSKLEHGTWLPWLRENCEVSERTARAYMRVARYWPELSKTATVANLNFRGALKLLSEPKAAGPEVTNMRVIETIEELKTWLENLDYYDPYFALEWCKNIHDGADSLVKVVIKQDVNKTLLEHQNNMAIAGIELERCMGRLLNKIDSKNHKPMAADLMAKKVHKAQARTWELITSTAKGVEFSLDPPGCVFTDEYEFNMQEHLKLSLFLIEIEKALDFLFSYHLYKGYQANDSMKWVNKFIKANKQQYSKFDLKPLIERMQYYATTGFWEPRFILGIRVSA